MPKKIRINPKVADDLIFIKSYLEEYDSSIATTTIKELYTKFELIAEFPGIGQT